MGPWGSMDMGALQGTSQHGRARTAAVLAPGAQQLYVTLCTALCGLAALLPHAALVQVMLFPLL